MRKINLIVPLILIAFQANADSTYKIKISDSLIQNVVIVDGNGNVKSSYDENGFTIGGMHENGTLFNDLGYDINGYNTEGLSVMECRYGGKDVITRSIVQSNSTWITEWEGDDRPPSQYTQNTEPYPALIYNNISYSLGDLKSSGSGIQWYEICRQEVKP